MVLFEVARQAYTATRAAERTLTVGELISMLEEFDPEEKIVTCHDGGYTYGGIGWGDVREATAEEEEEE